MRLTIRLLSWVSALALLTPGGVEASHVEGPDPGEVRFGISFGGISFTGFIVEYRWDNRGVEMNIGTWSFRDLSVSVVGKQYFGPGDFRPYAGLGLWTVVAPQTGDDERTGIALLARAPVGVEWNVDADHHLGGHISLNRALWIRRKNPEDAIPPSDRIVPLPGFFYLWRRR
ncbi:MAG: hypothetical protein PVJ76_05510 [Gemmatimonadota bacterium]|jgi:hypothetical protein